MGKRPRLPAWIDVRTVRYVVGIVFLALAICFAIGGHLKDNNGAFDLCKLFGDLWANLGAEAASIALTILVLDVLNERRADAQEKQMLIAQLGSPDNIITRQAIKVLWARGWLQDGTTQKANLWEANLENGDLGECDLRNAIFKRANLRGTRLWTKLEGAVLQDADLQGAMLQDPYVPERIPASFDETTILPNGTYWTKDTEMRRFTDPTYPDFWRSDDPRSPAYHGGSDRQ